MSKSVKAVFLLSLVLIFSSGQKALGAEAQKIRCTVYTAKEGKATASGETVHEGVLAGKPEWIGTACNLYDMDMNLIGRFEFKDTGKTKGIKNGTVIDVFCESKDKCDEWIDTYGDYVYMERIEE